MRTRAPTIDVVVDARRRARRRVSAPIDARARGRTPGRRRSRRSPIARPGEHDRLRADPRAVLDHERPSVIAARRARPRGAATRGLPSTAPSWTSTPSPMTTPSWTTTLAPNDDVPAHGRRRAEHEPGRPRSAHGGYPTRLVTANRSPLRGAVLGLGMIGRHHARLLQTTARRRVRGRRRPRRATAHGAVRDPAPRLRLDRGAARRRRAGLRDRRGADRGAPQRGRARWPPRRARARREAARRHRRRGARDHRARASAPACAARSATSSASTRRCSSCAAECRTGQLGEVFLIATERVGPFPDRVRDVGVVKDLATHDLDLVALARRRRRSSALAAQTQHRMGREHEDLVLVTGRAGERRAASTWSSTGCRRRRSAARGSSASAACSSPTR